MERLRVLVGVGAGLRVHDDFTLSLSLVAEERERLVWSLSLSQRSPICASPPKKGQRTIACRHYCQ